MKIEEMKAKLEKINKELEELQLEGVMIVLESGDRYAGHVGNEINIKAIKGWLNL